MKYISLFDELDDLGDADELLEALQSAAYVNEGPDLDFDIDIPQWSDGVSGSTCTDGDVSEDSLSPAHTFSSVPSPSSVEAPSPYSSQDEALSPQQQPSPVSVCSDSSGFSKVSPPPKKVPRRTTKTTQAQPLKRPIQTGPKISIQPKPIITTVPLATTPAALQPKTIIIQPLQTTVLPVVKQTPVSIQPAPPSGPSIVLSQPSQLLQIQTPQAITGGVVAMPTLSQDRPVSVSAPPLVSVQLRSPSSDDDSLSWSMPAPLRRTEKKDLLMEKLSQSLGTLLTSSKTHGSVQNRS